MNKDEKLKIFSEYNIYGITAEKFSNGRSNLDVVKKMLDAGVKIIQYREKYKTLRQKYEECLKIRSLTSDHKALLIVNDHVDLCLMVEADGVHIGQDDYPIEKVREILGDDYIIGVTTHTKDQILKAQSDGADYIGVGPVFASFTKDKPHPPIGIEIINWCSKNCNIPFVAIGGIKEDNILQVLDMGARCVALVTEIVAAFDITKKVERLNRIMEQKSKGMSEL